MTSADSLLPLLDVAKKVASEIPVPGLSAALEVAHSIAGKAKEIKDTRDGCRTLAERAACFSLGIYDQLKECDSDMQSIATKERVHRLLCTLTEIENLMIRRHKTKILKFLLRQGKIAKEVERLKVQLEDVMMMFMVRTGISNEQTMEVVVAANVRLLRHVEDSANVGDTLIRETRGIRHNVLDLAQRLKDSVTYDGAAVELAKKAYAPCILAVLGYSRPGDLTAASFLVTEDYTPFEEYLNSLQGLSKLRLRIQVMVDICVVVDHLELLGLHHLLALTGYYRDYESDYAFGPGEMVIDRRHGGRVKWAPAYRSGDGIPNGGDSRMTVAATQADRIHQVGDFRVSAQANADAVARSWLSRLLSHFGRDNLLPAGANAWRFWQSALDCPWYALGVWVGCNPEVGGWAALSTRDVGLDAAVAFNLYPLTVPRQDSKLPQASAASEPAHEDSDDPIIDKKLRMARRLDVPDQDIGEMCIDVELGMSRTKWKRYQFSRLPVGTTLLFQQLLSMQGNLDIVSRTVRSAPSLSSTVGYRPIGIATVHQYFTETTAYFSPCAIERMLNPLWFFLYSQPDHRDQSAPHNLSIPYGFWSSEKNPTSIPVDLIFDPTPRFEYLGQGCSVPLATWTQALGGLIFITQTKMHTLCRELTEDDLLAIKTLQDSDRLPTRDGQSECSNVY